VRRFQLLVRLAFHGFYGKTAPSLCAQLLPLEIPLTSQKSMDSIRLMLLEPSAPSKTSVYNLTPAYTTAIMDRNPSSATETVSNHVLYRHISKRDPS
jgi:hypothetical protein